MSLIHRRRSGSRRGYTVLELLIAFTIFASVAGTLAFAAGRGMSLFHDSGLQLEVRSRAERALDKASSAMLGVTSANMLPALSQPPGAPPVWSSDVVFTRTARWTPSGPVLTPSLRLLIERSAGETDDGTDENGNGLVDEYDLILVTDDGLPTEIRTVMGTGIAEALGGELPNGIDDNGNGLIDEPGFCVAREGDLLVLRVTTERLEGSPVLLSHTEEIAVAIRNP